MVWFEKSDLLQVFLFSFPVHVNCLAKRKQTEKKELKGIVYLFDSLRILFSYNLSAIKMWGFLFFISSISSVFVTCVKASYMFNKANYLVKNI